MPEDLTALHEARLGKLELEAALTEIGFYDRENGDLDPVLASTIFEIMKEYQKAENVELFINRQTPGESSGGDTDKEPEYLSIDEDLPDE